MNSKIIKYLPVVFFVLTTTASATEGITEGTIRLRLATDEVENQVALDREANPLYESPEFAPYP